MTSNHASAPPTGPLVPSVADAAVDLATAFDRLADAELAIRDAVLALSRTVGTGVCEAVEGLPPDLLLGNLSRQISSDRSTLLTAADVLRGMPAVVSLWSDGLLSCGQVRNICLKASRLRAADREVLDRRIAATADDADAYGPDGLLDAVDRAILDLRDPDDLERQQTYERSADFLSLQGRLDGGVRIYGEYAGGTGRRAKPLVDVLVDLGQVSVNAAGTVDLHIDGPLTTLTARTVEALTEDADLRVTLMDGARPLATSKKRKAPDAPTACPAPGPRSPGPTSTTHERAKGGDHHPDLLVSLRSRWHQLLHRRGWSDSLDPDTGMFTIEREGRRYRSLPKGTPLRPDPGQASGPDPPGDPPTDRFDDPLPF